MRKILISLCVLALFFEISGLILSRGHSTANQAMKSLLAPPGRTIQSPMENGYLLLLGFAAAPSAKPVEIGFSIWLEAELDRGRRPFNYNAPFRSDLRIPRELKKELQPLSAEGALRNLGGETTYWKKNLAFHPILVRRYKQWMAMPFEDWGYGHLDHVRFEEILVAHRLYLAEGFTRGLRRGLTRLKRDMAVWRSVMEKARTLRMKVIAATIVSENAALTSDLLSRSTTPVSAVRRASQLLQPLTEAERSMSWPIRNEFVVGMQRPSQSLIARAGQDNLDRADHTASLARLAGLHPDAFEKVERTLSNEIFGLQWRSQRTLNMQAIYYEAVMKAAKDGSGPLPSLKDVAKTSGRTLLDTFLDPIHEEPEWELFTSRMLETDARLRLGGLQVKLRQRSVLKGITLRIAHAGLSFYDPFSGLPMMWNRSRRMLYSVGRDGLDDGGDPTFDIAVAAVVAPPDIRPSYAKGKEKTKKPRSRRGNTRL